MDTPICRFVEEYRATNRLRLHMPGHKGYGPLGMEDLDITEIEGADSLFEASGIIMQSENNCSRLFGCYTCYSTEGSSLCIRAMLHLCQLYAKMIGKSPVIAAARNVHKAFLSGLALTGMDVHWLTSNNYSSYLSCTLSPKDVEAYFRQVPELPVALYLTSPDYLGSMTDIRSLVKVCHEYGVLVIVDNAHGAYLRFLPQSLHPMDLGADICCDSAHKTLSVLTGGAYLHLAKHLPTFFRDNIKNAMSLFASTSPSYLILQSLDRVNAYLAGEYPRQLQKLCKMLRHARNCLARCGYTFYGEEPLKLTLLTKKYGYIGTDLSGLLRSKGIESEFADPDYIVFMFTPDITAADIQHFIKILAAIPRRTEVAISAPVPSVAKRVLSPRDAMMSPSMNIPAADSIGRILAAPSVACPPAVPVLACGERIDEAAVECFKYYGISSVNVIIE